MPRLLGIAGLGALAVLIGVFARWDDNPAQAAADAVASFGLGILVPLATLWLGTSVVGDLIEDRLLVYLWLKPVPRWQLPAAAVLATATVVVPLTAIPIVASTLAAGASEVAVPACSRPHSERSPTPGCSLRRASGSSGRSGGVSRSSSSGSRSPRTPRRGRRASPCSAGRRPSSGWGPTSTSSSRRGRLPLAVVVLLTIAVAGWLLATWRYRRADVD